MRPTALPARSEIDPKHTWDTRSVFPHDEAWETSLAALDKKIDLVSSFEGRLSEGPETLLSFFAEKAKAQSLAGQAYIYAGGFSVVDTQDQVAQARTARAIGHYSKLSSALAFAEPELLTIDQGVLEEWMQEHEELRAFEHFFERLFDKSAHMRSGEVEKTFSMASEAIGAGTQTANILINAELPFAEAVDSQGQSYEVAQSTIGDLTTNADRKLRESAWTSYADGYLGFKRTLASGLNVAIKRDVVRSRIFNYPSSLESSLGRERIPTEVFHTLLDIFKRNLPTWHRYWKIRREALSYETLHPWDLKAPLTSDKPHVSYQQAVDWICEGMAPLGDDYVQAMRKGSLEDRWVDIYPNRGKTAGAFSSGVQGTHPFILVSYTDDLFSLSTLAHELGHSMHSYLTWKHQPPIYANYSLFVAEVASNFNQALVRDHLLRTQKDRAFQIALLEETMSNFHRYFFVMPTLARFELEIHERAERGQALTADTMIGLMADLFEEGFGGEVQMDREQMGITWAQFGHLYANFYVYQYATGISAAQALAKPILAGDEDAVERYLEFLSSGSSSYGLDVLRKAGVDMTQPESVEVAFASLGDVVDRLETLLLS